ncbi:CPBP family intramembrane glutamic endopeptidase [Butyrivibrio sp. LC3010]|uniref:CPBP family intramembrane glutamic endopeptidase n=1 Tax=Butyrivibrio sp. LC3010 TaxID=1280680 RepID=UPI0003F8B30B|nr:type II CAAX endopeptidase family protein [Butyrivibrio sp. LC3010]
MSKQQESNQVSIIFSIVLLLNVAIVIAALLLSKVDILMGIWSTVLAEAAIFVPLIIYLKKNGEPVISTLGFHKIKISTILLTILLTIVINPILIFGNLFSQLFVPNVIAQGASNMMQDSAAPIIMVISLLPPIFEEIFFRGFLFNKYRTISTIMKAAILSALFFGILHLNLNQFCYAFLLGIIFAFVNVASGSIVTSMIIHFLINFGNILMLYVYTIVMQSAGKDFSTEIETARQSGMGTAVLIWFVIAVIAAFIAKIIMQAIAKNEGHLEEFKSIFAKNSSEEKEVVHIFRTAPSIIATVLGVVAIGLISFYLPNVF